MRVEDSAIESRTVAAKGLGLSLLGVLSFSFTFPATTLALTGFGPWTIAGVRCVAAGLIAAACLAACRVPLPAREHWRGLAAVAVGCVLGFPALTTLALRTSSTAHSAVVTGLLPLATAVAASVLTRRHPPRRFWPAAAIGAVAVVVFTTVQSHGRPTPADLLLFAALVVCAVGYAEGARLAAAMPGWQVIAWGVVLALPVTIPMAVAGLLTEPARPDPSALLGLAYVALISQFGGFVAWYRGLADLGVARASQLQLAQPVLTLAWAALLLHESVTAVELVTAAVVLACVVVTQRVRAAAPRAHRGTA